MPAATRRPLRTTPATTLETAEEPRAFYKSQIEDARGIHRTGELRLSLENAYAAGLPFKAFFLGHPGVGKTTELTRLLLEVEDRFRP